MARNDVVQVGPEAPSIGQAEWEEALSALGGLPVTEGDDFDRLACIAETIAQARHSFIEQMRLLTADLLNPQINWRWRASGGTRREGAVTRHVVSARFKIVEAPGD